MERLLAGDELCLHRDDAAGLGIKHLAIINYNGIPGAFRVVLSKDDRDRGFVRLSYQSRMLLGVPQRLWDLLPEISVSAPPVTARGTPLLVSEPRWDTHRLRLPGLRKIDSWVESACRALLRAPEVNFRTVDALPGEDHACTVRLATELFPLLGTNPGSQVYVSWGGGRNHVIATALVADDPRKSPSQWASTDRVGHHSAKARAVPDFARLRVGAEIRVALGIPRTAVVTVRRRVSSLILAKVNELIIPATGLFIALNVDAKLRIWTVIPAVAVILILLLAPLRVRRNPQGRVP